MNLMLYACFSEKYYHPQHETSFLFLTNFLLLQLFTCRREIEFSEKHFYFLNANDNWQEAVKQQLGTFKPINQLKRSQLNRVPQTGIEPVRPFRVTGF